MYFDTKICNNFNIKYDICQKNSKNIWLAETKQISIFVKILFNL